MENKQYLNIERIKALMAAQGIEIKAMAEKTKIPPVTLKKLLNGANHQKLSSFVFYQIALALNVSADSLLNAEYQYRKK